MLVLSRKSGESIIIDGHTRIKLLAIHGKLVRLGIDAPECVSVIRDESRRTRIWISADALPKTAHPPGKSDSPPGAREVGYLVPFERFRSLNVRNNR